MSPRPKKLVGPLSEDQTQVRRGDQRGTPTEFPVVDRKGVIAVQVDPRGAIGTDPARGLLVRVGGGLAVETGSPFRIVPVLGAGVEVNERGEIVPVLSSSVRVNKKRQLVATPTTAEVTDPDGGTAQQTLARKANVGDVRFPIAVGLAVLSSGVVVVSASGTVSDSVILMSHRTVSGTQGLLSCSVSDDQFAILSDEAGDNSTVSYGVWNT